MGQIERRAAEEVGKSFDFQVELLSEVQALAVAMQDS